MARSSENKERKWELMQLEAERPSVKIKIILFAVCQFRVLSLDAVIGEHAASIRSPLNMAALRRSLFCRCGHSHF